MHPLLEEICRQPGVASVQAHCFNRWQRCLRDEIAPLLDEVYVLRDQVAALEAARIAALAAVPAKRGRGRPRKVRVEVPA